MEELAKNLWVQLGGFGALLGFLIFTHVQNRKDIAEERKRNDALQEKFVASLDARATSGTQVGVAMAAAQDKMADRVGGVETKLEILSSKVEGICKASK